MTNKETAINVLRLLYEVQNFEFMVDDKEKEKFNDLLQAINMLRNQHFGTFNPINTLAELID